ncbi:hypothetical protein B0B51_08385 [blood disease bacterium A2-HR MARDI]|uniref:Uncharacterized protein n=2 Tax=Ralstonia syzygii subsp. celebesensis TaxID=1310168 RepID=A0A1U9VH34_9RALS|nr:hypothetical protein B0B51_08385 [blood disease bacterium A2-HR MARDI]CCA80463.1 conserved hypothethical protein [blood disease bacterium R229]
MLALVGLCAGLGACGEAADMHVPAMVRGARPATADPAALPANAHPPARDGLAPPVMHTVDGSRPPSGFPLHERSSA